MEVLGPLRPGEWGHRQSLCPGLRACWENALFAAPVVDAEDMLWLQTAEAKWGSLVTKASTLCAEV